MAGWSTKSNPDLARAVIRRWNDGGTFNEVAASCGVTKSQVAGIIHRARHAKLEPVRSVGSPIRKRANGEAPKEVHPPKTRAPMKVSPEHPWKGLKEGKPPAAPRKAAPAAAPTDVPNFKPTRTPGTGCLYPMWADNVDPTHEYCGLPRAATSPPYCTFHRDKTTTKAPPWVPK